MRKLMAARNKIYSFTVNESLDKQCWIKSFKLNNLFR